MVKHFFSKEAESEIVEAIAAAEARTSGEIRVHIRKKCGKDPLGEAKRLFQKFGMHRTKEKNGVLIFVALESRQFAVIGDTGIHERVTARFWDQTRDLMAEHFKKNEIKNGLVAGVRNIGEKLRDYFPSRAHDTNELPDTLTED